MIASARISDMARATAASLAAGHSVHTTVSLPEPQLESMRSHYAHYKFTAPQVNGMIDLKVIIRDETFTLTLGFSDGLDDFSTTLIRAITDETTYQAYLDYAKMAFIRDNT